MGIMRVRAASLKPSTCVLAGSRGVSLLELVVSVAIILVISGMAMPTITRTLKSYQLNDAANQLAGILKFTRFEAIRKNTPIRCMNSQAGPFAAASIWSDNDGDSVAESTEKQILLGPNATLVAPGTVPSTAALATAAGIPVLTAISPASDAVKFDQRGAVVASPSAIHVFYLGNPSDPSGYRAVIVLPSGAVQVWTYAGAAGSIWQRIS
jgi:prepilin-type N-terminal cleavage/methylation domain-containing protein